jgi:hypothetical protein
VAYGQLGHLDEALHHLRPELSAGYPEPKSSLHVMLARALRKLGRDVEAKEAVSEAARLDSLYLESEERESGDAPPLDATFYSGALHFSRRNQRHGMGGRLPRRQL